MASAGQRRRRRRRQQQREPGQPWEADAQEKDSVRSSDCLEKLAQKYMQKCTVESSTESESESRAEVVPSPLAGRLKKAKDSRGLQFLDPYDGDSEDASVHSDCGMKGAAWTNSAPMPLENADTSEDEESFPNPPHASDIQAVDDYKAALELLSHLQALELPPGRALPRGIDPSAPAELPASPAHGALQPLLAAHSGSSMAKQPLIKRKHGIPTPEGATEKLRRKKFRAI